MNRTEFLPIFHGLADVRGLKKTDMAIEIWYRAVEDLTVEEFTNAVARFVRESTDFPSPAAVRQFSGLAGMTDVERAHVAWGMVRLAIRQHGPYTGIEFDDPLIHAAIRAMGGWAQLCGTESEQMQWRRREFVECYAACAKCGLGDGQRLSGLPGYQGVVKVETGLGPHPSQCKLSMGDRKPTALIETTAKALSVVD